MTGSHPNFTGTRSFIITVQLHIPFDQLIDFFLIAKLYFSVIILVIYVLLLVIILYL